MDHYFSGLLLAQMVATGAAGASRLRLERGLRTRQTRLSSAGDTSCAALDDGTVRCWGDTAFGQAGDGAPTSLKRLPVTGSGLTNLVPVTAGYGHACALRVERSVWCWGRNDSGQPGTGSVSGSIAPAQASAAPRAVAVPAGGAHACGLLIRRRNPQQFRGAQVSYVLPT